MNREPIPGTFADGFVEPRLTSRGIPAEARARRAGDGVRAWIAWTMGECLVHRFLDNDGLHLVVSHESRYPTWDELKVARYRLLPLARTFGLLMPPPAEYVDDERSRNVFELSEVERV